MVPQKLCFSCKVTFKGKQKSGTIKTCFSCKVTFRGKQKSGTIKALFFMQRDIQRETEEWYHKNIFMQGDIQREAVRVVPQKLCFSCKVTFRGKQKSGIIKTFFSCKVTFRGKQKSGTIKTLFFKHGDIQRETVRVVP